MIKIIIYNIQLQYTIYNKTLAEIFINNMKNYNYIFVYKL